MIEESNIDGVEYATEEPTVEQPAQTKRPAKSRRLAGIAMLALLAIVAVIILTPNLRNEFLKQPPKAAKAAKAGSAPSTPSTAEPGPLPAVPVAWEMLGIGAMPDDVVQNLRLGRYYYDRRQPGNFGLAIHYWKQALALRKGADRDKLEALVASAEAELARQFSSDSGDAVVLLKQGKREDAVLLLEKMRANYLDITAPQYIWTSVMLSRRRR